MNMSEVKLIELRIDDEEESGVYAIALVEQPAISVDFYAFNENFETYNDYGEGIRNNAKKGIELNEKAGNKCATQTGKVRAQQLANGEKISVETIKRMYSYLSRAEVYYDEADSQSDCGYISFLLWGGKAALGWSRNKLKELGEIEDEKLNAEDIEMIEGITELLLQVKDLDNRRTMLEGVMKDFDEEGIIYNRDELIKKVMGEEDFVKPRAGETEEEFIPRCMKVLIGDEGYDEKQAAAICYSYLEEKMGIDVSGLQPYIQNLKERKKKKRYEVQEVVLGFAREFGFTYGEIEKFANANLADSVDDIEQLSKRADYKWIKDTRVQTTLYKYEGGLRNNSRDFCIEMISLDKYYTFEMIEAMENLAVNAGFGAEGADTYSIWKYLGGPNCFHYWKRFTYKYKEKDGFELLSEARVKGLPGTPMKDRPRGGRLKMSYELFFDDDKMIVVGPAMIPDIEIPRKNENGDLYYVVFSSDTIKKIQEKFMKTQSVHNTNQDHDENKDAQSYIVETWIKETNEDKSNKYGFGELPVGTWFCMMKVQSKEVWSRIKNGELKGFSVEGSFIQYEK